MLKKKRAMLCIGRHAIYYKLLSKGRLQLYFKKVNSLKNKSVILNFIEYIRKIPINFLAEKKKKVISTLPCYEQGKKSEIKTAE